MAMSSKSYHLVELEQPSSSVGEPVKIDWSKCLLCQQVTSETLHCPSKSKHSDVSVGQGLLHSLKYHVFQ